MTTIDPFERDLPDAFTDLADAQTPDYFIDLLGRTARTRQRPTWAIPGRWFSLMPAITARPALAIVAIVIVAILGGAFLLNRSNQNVGNPSSSPSPSATPYASPLALPSALVGGWLAPAKISPIVQDGMASIYFGHLDNNASAPDFAIGGPGGDNAPSRVREVSPGVIEMTATGSLGGCTIGDVGHYGWSTTIDGTWLTLTRIDDACASRARFAPGSWVRNGSADSHGGPLVAANFDPIVSFTLPEGTWLGGGGRGVFTADKSDATFKVWQDPDGFNDYCSDALGTTALERGIDPFLAFLKGPQSGLSVSNQREITVDGHRAVVFDMGAKPGVKPPCWTNPDSGETNMILQWSEHADIGSRWATEIGAAPWPIVVTEVGGHTIVIEDVKGANALDQSVLDSIRFLDALPTPPTS
jgi:hypothetical protein